MYTDINVINNRDARDAGMKLAQGTLVGTMFLIKRC